MKKIYFLLFTISLSLSYGQDLVLTGIYDGPLSGGTPKGVELYAIADIPDLSIYGIGSANNGGGTDGEEFTFPNDVIAAGTYIYVASESTQFTNFFGFAPNYTSSAMGINGDDAVELFANGSVIDTFGDINTDGSGEAWDYLDGWAYRDNNTGPDGTTFSTSSWTYSGINVFDGTSTNASATPAMPIGTYTNNTLSTQDVEKATFSMFPNPTTNGFVNIKTSNNETTQVAVYDILGKQVINTTLSAERLNVSSLKAGVYAVRLSQGNTITTKKLVIK
ncbi:putative secreted protein (Por secretion system target) [Lacinutrix venerupis]|uniref:T9SS type A sorting domain-containing protein n=1 Tax=Lacinutrix venerupis TaxID=1486034 RepID=UPI000EAECDF9|nr:T9SS type A sorting domain-containing protein [Lacinutrix venerupis]RLJ65643.1 putative secreted protein (Por secretion system target) [Lacinutrix venerupis]